jgi:hypothetical protein
METTSVRKCQNCGGALQQADADTLKCPYCGCTYSLNSVEQPATTDGGPAAGNTGPMTYSSGAGSNNSRRKIFWAILLVVIGVAVAAIIINGVRVARVAQSAAPDSLKGNNQNAALKILNEDDEKEAHLPHIKKTFPEPEIVVTKHRVGMDAGDKVIFIAYRNKSAHEFERVEFNMQLFDAEGREIAVPDSEKTKQLYKRAEPGESDRNDWMLENGLAQAKTAKVTLKKVVLDSVVWDY